MTTQNTASRTCISCSIQKPLAAFLQITGTQGTVYGNVCSTCRAKTTKAKATIKPEADEEDSSASGLRIGAKEKIHADLEEKQQRKKLKESHIEEAKKNEGLKTEKKERTEIKIQSEKDHRRNYIETKQKTGFLGYQPKTPSTVHDPAVKRSLQEKQAATETQQTLETEKIEKVRSHEEKSQNIDFGYLSIDSQAKYRSGTFQRFKAWLGASAPLSTMERLNTFQKKEAAAAKEPPNAKDPLENFIDKNWKPTSTRRR